MSEKMDKDLRALRIACRALQQCTSYRMIMANMAYLNDYFLRNPPKDLREKFHLDKPRRLRP